MTKTQTWIVAGWLTLVMGLVSGSVQAAEPATSANAAMGRRLCALAQSAVPAQSATKGDWQQCAALLEAARRADPTNPRYPRLLADTLSQLASMSATPEETLAIEKLQLEALAAYRKLQPADQGAQLEVVALYLQRMQTADQKIKYLNDLVAKDSVPPEVRAVWAATAAGLLVQSGKDIQAKEMVERALSLDPLNLPALRLKLSLTPDAPGDRAAIMLAMLRSNPVQADVVLSLARLLAKHMLVKESVEWYAAAGSFPGLNADVAVEYAAQLLLSDQVMDPESLPKLLDQLIAADPQNYEALVLRILAEKRREKPDEDGLKRWQLQARNGLLNQLAVLRQALGVKEATTQPVADNAIALPDLAGDVALWKGSQNEELKQRYLSVVWQAAWLDVYLAGNADEAEKLHRHGAQLADATDPVATCIEGWIYLIRNKPEDAAVKLSAAEKGLEKTNGIYATYAKLGLIRLLGSSPDEQAKAKRAAEELVASARGGSLAAVLWEDVRRLGVRILPDEHAGSIRAALAKFPRNWLNVIGQPQAFYMVRGEPLKISYAYGEPVLVRVVIQNTGDQDLTIGPEGVIRPTVFIDVQLHGLARQLVPAACVERLTEQVVLRPKQSISRIVRIDQVALAQFLDKSFWPPVAMTVTVRTNPTANGGCGPCGNAFSLSSMMERSGFPRPPSDQVMQKLVTDVASGSADEKIRVLDVLSQLPILLQEIEKQVKESSKKENSKDVSFQGQIEMAREAIRKSRADADPWVRAWAMYKDALALPANEQAAVLKSMVGDSAWQSRLLGLVLVSSLPADDPLPLPQRKELVVQAQEKETQTLVKDFATATLNLLNQPAATQPAAGSAEGQGTGPK